MSANGKTNAGAPPKAPVAVVLFYDRIMDMKLIRFFRHIAGLCARRIVKRGLRFGEFKRKAA